jgi:hypothetical protein
VSLLADPNRALMSTRLSFLIDQHDVVRWVDHEEYVAVFTADAMLDVQVGSAVDVTRFCRQLEGCMGLGRNRVLEMLRVVCGRPVLETSGPWWMNGPALVDIVGVEQGVDVYLVAAGGTRNHRRDDHGWDVDGAGAVAAAAEGCAGARQPGPYAEGGDEAADQVR